jgi:hypothetical protein
VSPCALPSFARCRGDALTKSGRRANARAAASTLCCTANSLALGGPALGAVATDDALREVVIGAGFKEFRRATETPFNRVFEARR